MLIKEWEYENFLKNIKGYKLVLIHGPDRGKVNEKSNEIYKSLNQILQGPIEKIEANPEELNTSKSYLHELLYQKSFFSSLIVIKINLDLIKIDKEFITILETIDLKRSNFIILESEYLKRSSTILSLFKKENFFALITCYQDTNNKNTILKYAKHYSLSLDEVSLNHLSESFGNDSMITKSELKKLALYANGKSIDFNTVLYAIGDNSIIGLNNLSDSIGIENLNRVNYLYDKVLSLGLNNILILKSLSRHFKMLIEAKFNNIKIAKNIKPLIHFSRHPPINKQLEKIRVIDLESYIEKIYFLEISCKLNSRINALLIRKMLFDILVIK